MELFPPPEFAIVGALKCGTTALYTYLSDHPGVCMSARKEPFFWSPDIPRTGQLTFLAEYQALWAHASPGALRGEASAEYLRSSVAIPRLLAARPGIRLIAMVRNPAEVVASLHSNLLLGLQEDVRDLEVAWRLQEKRQQDECLPPGCVEPGLLQYASYGAIGDQLERFVEIVPADQRLIVLYDDFRADPGREYRRALEFLGLADDGRTDFPRIHANRVMHSVRLARLYQSSAKWLGPLYQPARAFAHALGLRPVRLLDRLNVRAAPRQPLDRQFEQELIAELLPQTEKVERALGRDLSGWKTPRA